MVKAPNVKQHPPLNNENKTNQSEFSCACSLFHSQDVEESMVQCLLCEDWFHDEVCVCHSVCMQRLPVKDMVDHAPPDTCCLFAHLPPISSQPIDEDHIDLRVKREDDEAQERNSSGAVDVQAKDESGGGGGGGDSHKREAEGGEEHVTGRNRPQEEDEDNDDDDDGADDDDGEEEEEEVVPSSYVCGA